MKNSIHHPLSTIHDPVQFFIDFDGTITTTDVVDLILESFADSAWRTVEKEWASGKIGSRECLERQIGLVSATEAEVSDLLSSVRLDPGFEDFLKKAGSLRVPVTIVSDGFRWVIQKVFEKNLKDSARLLKDIPVFANDLSWKDPGGPQAVFPEAPCEHGCANCKVAAIRRSYPHDLRPVFVGDGLSDRFATAEADIVFAKGKLAAFCDERGLSYRPYSTFNDIKDWLTSTAGGRGGMIRRATARRIARRRTGPAVERRVLR